MAWIESSSLLTRHSDLFKLANELKISKVQAVGHLIMIWESVGVFNEYYDYPASEKYIAEIAQWKGNDITFYKALMKCGWINKDGRLDFKNCAHIVYGKPLRPGRYTWEKMRYRILSRDDFTCRYCKKKSPTMQVDHVIPVTRGGGHDESNLVAACRSCNIKKGNKLPNGIS